MFRASVAGLVVALWASAAAQAHVTLSPPFVNADAATIVTFETPNERSGHTTTSLEVVAPPGAELAATEAPAGWTLELTGNRARWRGGRIAGGQVVSFPLVVTARARPGTVTFAATQRYDDGQAVSWDAGLTVLPASAEDSPPQHLRRALMASVVGLLVIAGSFAAIRRLRRAPLQEK